MKTREVLVGNVRLGGGNPVRVQSMCNTKTWDVAATVGQIKALEKAGCDMVRVAVPDARSVKALATIRKKISIPLIADIHFDPELALLAIPYVDKLRINPGTIPKRWLKQIVEKAKSHKIPIRVGINAGSLEKGKGSNVNRMVASAGRNVRLLESFGFRDIVVALKSSDVSETIEAYRRFSRRWNYPLHLGLTEAGFGSQGIIKSSVCLGVLLSEGIGDTIRVSLTGDPVQEVEAAYDILLALKLRQHGPEIIACPTCGRCSVDLEKIASEIKLGLKSFNKPIKIAIMGCEVNGPGEAKNADVGLAFSNFNGFIFKKGKIVETVESRKAVQSLLKHIRKEDL